MFTLFLFNVFKIIVCYYIAQIVRLFVKRKLKKTSAKKSILIIFGSGGHTTEMLMLFKDFDFKSYDQKSIYFLLANTDKTSQGKIYDYLQTNKVNIDVNNIQWLIIPRSREVGQSYFTSIFTTIYSFIITYLKILKIGDIDITITNGPGTCIPVVIAQLINKYLLIYPRVKFIFFESFCRVIKLSVSGYLLYFIVDKFLVHWPELVKRYPRAKYIGTLI